MKVQEYEYKHRSNVKLFTISVKSIVIMHGKIFIKTEYLIYFNKIQKYSKV